ncbi:MAG: cyclase family protein [Acidobacteria bacterium]|nr:cyclase family protein [Acidobacteriota bacterium]
MKFITLVLGAALALGLFGFVQHRSGAAAAAAAAAPERSAQFRNIMDLSAARRRTGAPLTTRITAPAQFIQGAWKVDDIPPQRLVGALVVLDVRAKAAGNSSCAVSIDDIDHWERIHGEIPPYAIVVALTGRLTPGNRGNFAAYSSDSIHFLADGRHALALGTDAAAITTIQADREALARAGAYELSGVSNLGLSPESGAILLVAPAITGGASEGEARLLALLR